MFKSQIKHQDLIKNRLLLCCTRFYSNQGFSTTKNVSNSKSISSIKKREKIPRISSQIASIQKSWDKGTVTRDICLNKDKSPSNEGDNKGQNASHIFTSKLDKPGYSSYGGGFEHIDPESVSEEQDELNWSSLLTNPRIISRHLDDYVIGQDSAKKILSVAVFNHYSRVKANLKNQTIPRKRSEDFGSDLRNKDNESTSAPRVPLPITNNAAFQYHQLKRSWINPSSDNISTNESAHSEVDTAILDTVFDKSNVLLLGPTGSGKTLLARTLADILNVPFSMSDATPFTQAGYVGEDVELVIQRLLQNCDFDIKKAEQGIVFIDEIDKIARRPDALSISKDVSGEGVQQALLRMLEGTNITITDKTGGTITSGRKGQSGSGAGGSSLNGSSKGDTYTVDTSNILFILSGAFVGLEKIVMDRVSKSSIGFNAPIRLSKNKNESEKSQPDMEYLDSVEPGDLVKYGLIPEFIGRLPVLANVSVLDETALVRVLTEPKNCLVKQYQGLFKLNKVELKFTSASLRAVAQLAITKQTGARGLRRIMEKILLDPMYEVPGTSVKYVLITRDCVLGKQKPHYLAKNQEEELASLIIQDEAVTNENSNEGSESPPQQAVLI